jgi:hypothetical protein
MWLCQFYCRRPGFGDHIVIVEAFPKLGVRYDLRITNRKVGMKRIVA